MPDDIKFNSQDIPYSAIESSIQQGKLSTKTGVKLVDNYIQQLALLRLKGTFPEESHTNLKGLLTAHDNYYRTHYSGFEGFFRKLASKIANAWNKQGWNTTYSLQNKAIRAELIPHQEYHYQRSKILFREAASEAKQRTEALEQTLAKQLADLAKPKAVHLYQRIDLSALAKVPNEPSRKELPVIVETPVKPPKVPAPTWGNRIALYFFSMLSPLPPPKYEDLVPQDQSQAETQAESEPEPEPQLQPEVRSEQEPAVLNAPIDVPQPTEPPPPPPLEVQKESQAVVVKSTPPPLPTSGIAIINEALLKAKPNVSALAATFYLNNLFESANVVEVVPGRNPGEFLIKLEKPLTTNYYGATVNLAKELTLVTKQEGDQLTLQFTKGFTAKYWVTVKCPPLTITPSDNKELMDTRFSASIFSFSKTYPLSTCLEILSSLEWS